jgi:hypothetical protein
MTINLNTNPYYDDFSEEKNYVKILFKPSFAVQARELTQLQTALQKQISRFGAHVFKDGSVVLGGKTATSVVNWIDVQSTDVSGALNKTFQGVTSGALGKVFKVDQYSLSIGRLYFTYISGVEFQDSEVLLDVATEIVQFTALDDPDNFTGTATAYSVEEGVFFVNQNFVYCEPQQIILTDTQEPITKKVGLNVSETIVTSNMDETLLDPAQGSFNFAAPGADRLAINLELVAYDFNPEAQDEDNLGQFVELSRFVENELVVNVTAAEYSELETTLARRTYDESGDYTVRSFGLRVTPHKFGDVDKLTLAIEPGKAYVKGYEFETISTVYTDLEKARAFDTRNNSSNQIDFGSYVIVNAFSTEAGSPTAFNFNNNLSVTLRDGSNNIIGTAVVRGIQNNTSANYRLYLYNVSMTGAFADVRKISNAASLFNCLVHTGATEYANGVRLIRQNSRSLITRLPKSPVKTLKTATNSGNSETSYRAFKTVTADFITGVANIPAGSGEELSSTNPRDYVVVFPNGTVKTVSSIGGTSSSRTVTLSDTSNQVGASVFLYVNVQVASEKQKVLQNNFSLSPINITSGILAGDAISLGKSDCYKLISVIAKDTAVTPVADLDVTQYFDFDNGQRDEFYDHGSVSLKPGTTIPAEYDQIVITFSYFTQSTSTGFFSVDSYPSIAYEDIPSYRSSTGEVFDLRDCIDFRPRRDDNAATITGSFHPVIEDFITADFEYYLSRVDKLVLTKERKFDVIKGIPAEYPTVPSDLYDAMTLYIINVPAYTVDASVVATTFIDNRRYTMRDIGKIDRRVERLENYTVMSLLEQESKDEAIFDALGQERFKNGIIVDSFSGHSVGDVNNPDYSCSIDPEQRTLRPRFTPYSFEYNASNLGAAVKEGDLVSLPYTTEILVDQPFATRTVNLNPYQVFAWNGQATLNPATDTWIDVQTRPDVVVNLNGDNDVYTTLVPNVNNPAAVGVRWNDWQTVNRGVIVQDNFSTNTSVSTSTNVDNRLLQTTTNTTVNNQITTVTDTLQRTGTQISTSAVTTVTRDLGTRVVDTSVIPFIRSRLVKFAAKNMKPVTNLLATFDGIDVTAYCTPAVEIVFSGSSVQRNATKVRKVSAGGKEAEVVLTRNDRAFIVMDAGNALFTTGESVEWLVGGVWLSGGAISEVNEFPVLATNRYGDVAGVFFIPNSDSIRFRTGERTFRLADTAGRTANTAAEVKYVASGMSQSVERTIVATRVATQSISPVTETTTRSSTSTNNIVVSNTSTTVDITPPPPPPPPPLLLRCDESQSGAGRQGTFEFELDFGSNTGNCGITYNAMGIPDRYTIIWDGNSYSSGFVGSSTYNSRLNSLGFPNVNSAGTGQLIFNKTKSLPNKARLIVDAPLSGTAWNFKIVCPTVVPSPPPVAPEVVVTAAISLPSSLGIASPTLNTSGGLISATNFGAAVSLWNGNSAVANNVTYTLQSVTSNNAGITVTLPAVGQRTTTKGNSVNGITLRAASGVRNNTSFTLTATWVTTDTSIPVNKRTLTTTVSSTLVFTGTPRIDPVAQTFFIDANQYPNGVFIKKIDLFFKQKAAFIPVQVQLRPTVNGYPSATDIIPFGVASLNPEDINVSQNGTVPTTFEFSNIIHLAPGEYSFVALADTDEYEIFTSKLGEFSISNPTERVTRQPTLGSMFKSQNASTWTPEQEEDVKFVIHKCVFETGTSVAVEYNTDISNLTGTINYDLFYTMGEVVDFAATNIDYAFRVTGEDWVNYQLGSNVPLLSRKTLETANDVRFRTTLTTQDRNITPIVDVNRLSSVLVQNIVNNDFTDETFPFGGAALSKYITRRAILAPGLEATDLKAFLIANIPAGASIKVYYRVGVVGDTLFEDNLYEEMEIESSGVRTDSGFVTYKYKTPYVVSGDSVATSTGDRFDTYSIKIVMLSTNPTAVPEIKNLRVIALDD